VEKLFSCEEKMLTEDAIGKNFMDMPRTPDAKSERESENSNSFTR
jgi:hypothetical protein